MSNTQAIIYSMPKAPAGRVAWYCGPAGWTTITEADAQERIAAANASLWAAAQAKQPSYPTRWPAKHKPVLDRIRDMFGAGSIYLWSWYRDFGIRDVPKGSFVIQADDSGVEQVFSSIDELAAHLGTEMPKKSAKTSKAQLLGLTRRLFAVALPHIDDEFAVEATTLLEAA